MRIRLPDHGTVVAYVALFVAVGGAGAYAANTIGSSDIKRNAVKAQHVAPGSVKANHVARNAVKAKQIAPNAVRRSAIARGHVRRGHIAPGAVGPGQLAPAARRSGGIVTASVRLPSMAPAQAVYAGFGGSPETSSEEGVATLTPARDLVLRDLRLELTGSVLPSIRRFTLRLNGADTSIDCTLATAAQTGGSCAFDEELSVPAGSLLSLRIRSLDGNQNAEARLRVAFALDPA